ncbi:SEC-C motif-containing protein [Myroides gitamensis]|uniref:YchJ family protein n=1 Tax=Myroides odoratus TaxID=256 RepID=UPI002166E99D|nr:YchJ family metal-binding protein [Myroides odoratus]MCS4239417.1 SEC-C motif-containing protein [Myroides odoratus]MDH6602474.1 SEC-C motif-containing protein [Myroides gitamensis]
MLNDMECPCGSEHKLADCCMPFLQGTQYPTTAEALMRSRYTAYVVANAKYLIDTTHPRTRHLYSKKSILQWASENQWLRLEIESASALQVVFRAYFKDAKGQDHQHYENSTFEFLGEKLYYVSGTFEE